MSFFDSARNILCRNNFNKLQYAGSYPRFLRKERAYFNGGLTYQSQDEEEGEE